MKNVIDKAVGAILMPYVRIGGRRILKPPFLTRVQTDGSYGRHLGGGRVAAVVTEPDGTRGAAQMIPVKSARNSTEAEWASVEFGMRMALENDHEAIALENDNLGVIAAIIHPQNPLKHAYARHYRDLIFGHANKTLWTGVRWIPREANRADDLF
jgi:hypothetical protein